ncbi:hypothetical protein EDB81DRAFT_684658 [Dactylonectria macrodidyma]|uniref:Glycoside hydrolase 131 catalytic N-terminal domain-containing protein n=1 Tax=Dactylonectria macrodidyma TaxID=307937 RepID=A0A9P9JFM5_9HYPO|nr:hypothetical protein EDB81DRAFT_684658 [Dactylonectria macrodidyma]
MKTFAAFASLAGLAAADILWDGRFNDLKSSTDLESWSWSNQVGPYQYYIHGDGEVTEYVNLAADFGNPDDAGSSQGAKITLTDTAYWNGQTMRRTELIPQTSAAIAAGKVFYHFSIKRSDENAPSLAREHQIAFFESHFTELKSGLNSGASGTEDNSLRWLVGGTEEWTVDWEADVWHNIAYEIDFDASTVGLWHSTGATDLKQVVAPVTADTSSNGADWHVGVLELANGDADETEDFYFSGVYIEDGDITTSVSGPGGASSGGGSSGSASSAVSSAAAVPTAATSSAAAGTVVATSVAVPTSAADATTLVSKVVSQVASEAVSTAPATSVAVVATSVADVTSVAQTSLAQATSVAQVTATPIVSSAVPVTTTSSSAAATATQKSPCKVSRRSRRSHHRRS